MTKSTRKILLIAALALLLVATCALAACDILDGLFGGGECQHEFGEWHEGTPATCSGSGQKGYYTCKKCGKRFDRDGVTEINDTYIDIDTDAHQMTYHPEVPATCGEWGTKEYFECKVCGQLFADEYGRQNIWYEELNIEPLGNHSMTFVDGVEPTCTTDGIIEHWHCSNCNGNFEDESGHFDIYNVVRPKQHSVTTVYANSPSCTRDGNVKYYHCEECGNNFSDYDCTTEISDADIIVAATGHSIEHVDAVENTHDTDGNVEHWHCNNCNKNFANEEATTQIDATIPKGHHWGDNGICKECDQEEYSTGLKFTLQDDNTYKVSKGTFNGRELIIPSKYEGKKVTVIAENGFKDCSALETVSLTSTVTNICNTAFSGCPALKSIYLPAVSTIGKAAFENCSALKDVTLSKELTAIGEDAFDGCERISSVHYDSSNIGTWLEKQFANEKSNPLYYGNELYVVVDGGYQLLTELVLDAKDESTDLVVNAYAFINCTSLTKVTFGVADDVTINSKAFEGCTELTGVYLKDLSIRQWASTNFADETANPLYYAHNLYYWSVLLYDDYVAVEVLGDYDKITPYAFINCTTLLIATLPKDTGDSAFKGCSSLRTITLPWTFNLEKYFGGVVPSSLKTVYFSDENDLDSWAGTLTYSSAWSNVEEIVFPEGITSLLEHDFNNLTSLKTLVLPESVRYIDAKMFEGCSEKLFNSYSDGLYLGTKTNKYKFFVKPTSTDITRLELHEDCKEVALYAFEGCSQIEILYTPIVIDISGLKELYFINADSSVIDLEKSTCASVETLTKLSLPANVTKVYIGGCTSLESLTIPNTARSISITNCPSLTTLKMPVCNGATIPNSVKDLYLCVIDAYGKLPENTDIPEDAFIGHTKLERVTLGGTSSAQAGEEITDTMSIGSGAFAGCTALKEIWIYEKVTSIGSNAFSKCDAIQTVNYYGASASIDKWAEIEFGNAAANPLGNLHVNGKLVTEANLTTATKINSYAFCGCTSLTSIVIPSSVTSIGEKAFYNCSSITIYCEADSQPSGWNSSWNYSSCPVVWDCNNNDVAADGNIYAVIDGIRYALKDGVATVIHQPNNVTSATIPASVTYKETSYSVTSIDSSAFSGCSKLTTVTFGDNSQLKSIGSYAFNNCNSLTSIEISSSVTSIGGFAFWQCYNLSSVTFGENSQLTSIGTYAFYYCYNLTSIVIPNNVTSIDGYAFYSCKNLTIYCEAESQPSDWASTWNNSNCLVVWDCNNNEVANDGNIYTVVDGIRYALKVADNTATVIAGVNCSGSVVIPSVLQHNGVNYPVTSIKNSAFANLDTITSVTIGDNVVIIEPLAFLHCDSLTSVTFGENSQLTSIGDSAFWSCDNLTSIVIPDNVTSIGEEAFRFCNLTSVTIGSSVTSVKKDAFYGCNSIEKVYFNGTIDQWAQIEFANEHANPLYYSKELYINDQLVTEVNLTTTTKIGSYSFFAYGKLTSITINENVITTGANAFYGCNGIEKLYFTGTIDQWAQIEFANEHANPLYYSKELYINDQLVTEVNLTTATKIGSYSFFAYGKLTIVTMGDSVQSVGKLAFASCRSLENITIGNGVKTFGDNVFINCTKLNRVDYTGTLNQWVQIEFSGESSTPLYYATKFYVDGEIVTEANLTGVTSIGDYAFYNIDSLLKVTIPESVTSIGARAFYNCEGLLSITIPSGVTSIGERAFYNCSNLTIFCEAESKPGDWSKYWNFSNCHVVWDCKNNDVADDGYIYTTVDGIHYALKDGEATVIAQPRDITSIVIPSSVTYNDVTYAVTTIKASAFEKCDQLTDVTIPHSVTSCESKAFFLCSAIENVYYTGTVDQWVQIAFAVGSSNPLLYASNFYVDNQLVTEITITAQSIGQYAFYGFDGLFSVTIAESVENIGKGAFYATPDCYAIYCEVTESPSGWNVNWNDIPSRIVWDCNNNDAADDGYIYTVVDGIRYALMDGEATVAIQPKNTAVTTIPSTITYKDTEYPVTTIANVAFNECQNLTSIVIGDNVVTIGRFAFADCKNLESVTIGNGVITIEYYAFDNCEKLANLTWGSNVETLGTGAFTECTSLTSVVIPDSVIEIGEQAFGFCTNLANITLGSGVATLCDNAFVGCTSLTSFVITQNVTTIGNHVFNGCTGLSSIVIPSTVTSLGFEPFLDCGEITIYCEAESTPDGWRFIWATDNCTVVWGYTGD